jgi:hypothetical protein
MGNTVVLLPLDPIWLCVSFSLEYGVFCQCGVGLIQSGSGADQKKVVLQLLASWTRLFVCIVSYSNQLPYFYSL